jgi:hypothetical protein
MNDDITEVRIIVSEEAIPSPMAYNTGRSVKHLYKAAPSFTIVRKDYSQERWVKNSGFN